MNRARLGASIVLAIGLATPLAGCGSEDAPQPAAAAPSGPRLVLALRDTVAW